MVYMTGDAGSSRGGLGPRRALPGGGQLAAAERLRLLLSMTLQGEARARQPSAPPDPAASR